jgi:hypothetical protein
LLSTAALAVLKSYVAEHVVKRRDVVLRFLVVLVILALVGCAPPSTLTQETAAKIKKVGIVTRIADNEPVILDHTSAMKKSYTHGQFGLLGAAIEGGINLGIRQYRYSKSVTDSPDTVKPFVPYSSLKRNIDVAVSQKLSQKFVAVEPSYFDARKVSLDAKDDCFAESKKAGIDTLVFLDIAYGLAAYDNALASLSVDADMTVFDVASEDVLLKKRLESDQNFKENRKVEDLARDDGKLFKQDLDAAVEGFSVYVGAQMGVER